MTVGELKDLIKNTPDDVKVFVETNYAQCPESAVGILVCFNKKIKSTNYGEDFSFEDISGDSSKMCKAQAILIS